MSPEHEALRSSIFNDALTIIGLIKIPDNPFYEELQRTAIELFTKEDIIRAYVQESGEERKVPQDIWTVLSNPDNVLALRAIMGQAKQTFRRAGLVPPDMDDATPITANNVWISQWRYSSHLTHDAIRPDACMTRF